MISGLILIFILYVFDLKIIKPRREARKYADTHYELCNPPPLLWANRETNTWETRERTDHEKWLLCYKSRLKRGF